MEENKIPVQATLEEQLEDLRNQLNYEKKEEKRWLRETKREAFRMAIQIKSSYVNKQWGGVPQPSSMNVEDLIKSANKIYEELIK